MATRAAAHVHGPRKAFVIHCVLMYCLLLCVCITLYIISSCSWSLCVCYMLYVHDDALGVSARAVVTGHSLCLASGQHTFDVFIVLKIRGVIYGKKFFLTLQIIIPWSKLPLNRFQISEDETPPPQDDPTVVSGKIQKTGPIPYPIVG